MRVMILGRAYRSRVTGPREMADQRLLIEDEALHFDKSNLNSAVAATMSHWL